jgi:hypothetical protein
MRREADAKMWKALSLIGAGVSLADARRYVCGPTTTAMVLKLEIAA